MSRLLNIIGASLLSLSLNACCNSNSSNSNSSNSNNPPEESQESVIKRFKEMMDNGRILNVSANDYCINHKKKLELYNMKMVSMPVIKVMDNCKDYTKDYCKKNIDIVRALPERTEAIVGYNCYEDYGFCHGTALISKLDVSKIEEDKK